MNNYDITGVSFNIICNNNKLADMSIIRLILFKTLKKTSNVRHFDSLNPRLWKAEVFFCMILRGVTPLPTPDIFSTSYLCFKQI